MGPLGLDPVNMYTLARGAISYIRTCDYLRHDSNNQAVTHTVNKLSTYNLDGHQSIMDKPMLP